MTVFILTVFLTAQVGSGSRDWQEVLSQCIAGKALTTAREREQTIQGIGLEEDEATRTAKLACVYFSTAKDNSAKYANNSVEAISRLLKLAMSKELSRDEIGLISQVVCLSIDASPEGRLLEKRLWDLSKQISLDRKGIIISAFRFATWENAQTRIEHLLVAFNSDLASDDLRESVILAIGGALVNGRIDLQECATIFSDIHQLSGCTDRDNTHMLRLISEHIESEKATTRTVKATGS